MKEKLEKRIISIFDIIITLFWLIISLFSVFFAINEIIYLIGIYENGFNETIHALLTIFIFIEIISMVKKYFEENHHFPKRYLIYIAITALARHIIGDMEHALVYSLSLLVLVIAITLISVTNKKYELKG